VRQRQYDEFTRWLSEPGVNLSGEGYAQETVVETEVRIEADELKAVTFESSY
tara:strand:+ start:125 stop:280 length:156 start_codon:yes stop_codon:yes gene_type:complete